MASHAPSWLGGADPATDAACPQAIWANGQKLHWPFDDPAAVEGSDAEKLAAFRAIRGQLSDKIQSWLG